MTQYFKGDTKELQIEAAGKKAFDVCSTALNAYFDGCYSANDFLLMLYDNGRMPFSQRVSRGDFVTFINRAIPNFPITGTFESYILLLSAIFGGESDIQFDVTDPGKLSILVNASAAINSEAIVKEFQDNDYVESNLVTSDFDQIVYQTIAGIDSEDKLKKLLSELIPVGIVADITLDFFVLSYFVADEGGDLIPVVDHLNNQIVFFETP